MAQRQTPQRSYRNPQTLREGLNDTQMNVIAEGFQLLRTVILGDTAPELPKAHALAYAEQAVGLIDAFAAADKEND